MNMQFTYDLQEILFKETCRVLYSVHVEVTSPLHHQPNPYAPFFRYIVSAPQLLLASTMGISNADNLGMQVIFILDYWIDLKI
jgi:hypothetical protein